MLISLNRVRKSDTGVGAAVFVEGKIISTIDFGYLVYVGLTHSDSEDTILQMAEKIAKLNLMEDAKGRLGKSIIEEKGAEVLVVSSITLYSKIKKNSLGFSEAASPEHASRLFNLFVQKLKELGIPVKTGQFGANMEVVSTNWGPVVLQLEQI